MKMKRKDVEVTLESTIQTLRNTLDYVREQESRERDDKILLHRPRLADQSSDRQDTQEGLQEAEIGDPIHAVWRQITIRVIPRARLAAVGS